MPTQIVGSGQQMLSHCAKQARVACSGECPTEPAWQLEREHHPLCSQQGDLQESWTVQ